MTIYLTDHAVEPISYRHGHTEALQDAILFFADFDRCRQFMVDLRWPDGKVTCPQCGSGRVIWLANARVWKCYEHDPKAKFTLKTGTIFEDSPLGLDKWLAALWLIVNCKNGISSASSPATSGSPRSPRGSCRTASGGAAYRTFDRLSSDVEVDETFIGGKARNMHMAASQRRITGTGGKTRPSSSGSLSATESVRAHHGRQRRKKTLQARSRETRRGRLRALHRRAALLRRLASDYAHQVIDHAVHMSTGRSTPTGWRTSGAS